MARRKLCTFNVTPNCSDEANTQQRCAIVYYDSQWQDNIVEYYRNGNKIEGASSHHWDDREDAYNSARSFVAGKI